MELVEEIRKIGISKLLDKYKLKLSRHKKYKSLILLKYDQRKTDFSIPLCRQCRGICLDEKNDLKIVSYPFDKFFNAREPLCLELDWEHEVKVFEKLDGSLCTLYWYGEEWNVSSSGVADGGGVLDGDLVFRDLFWKVFKSEQYELPKDTNVCYCFELLSPKNPILVKYEREELFLIGGRDLTTLKEIDVLELGRVCGYKTPKVYNFKSLEETEKAAKFLNAGICEGFVCVDRFFNRCKVKCPSYVALAHLSTSNNKGLNETFMLQIVVHNEQDEFLAYYPEWKNLYLTTRTKYDQLVEVMNRLQKEDDYEKNNEMLQKAKMKMEGTVVEDYLLTLCADELASLVECTSKQRKKIAQSKAAENSSCETEIPEGMVVKKNKKKKTKKPALQAPDENPTPPVEEVKSKKKKKKKSKNKN